MIKLKSICDKAKIINFIFCKSAAQKSRFYCQSRGSIVPHGNGPVGTAVNSLYLGFTFVELLVTLFLCSILLLIAYPSLTSLIEANRAEAFIEQFTSVFHYARLKAMESHSVVMVCGSSDQEHCDGRWKDGQIILMNKSSLASSQILRVYPPLKGKASLTFNGFNSNDYLLFYPKGFTNQQNGTFTYCSRDGALIQRLVISKTGRVRQS